MSLEALRAWTPPQNPDNDQTMDIHWEMLSPETLRSLVEEFVTRGGTDYGFQESSLETRVKQVIEQLKNGKAKIVFDPETESCDIQEAKIKT